MSYVDNFSHINHRYKCNFCQQLLVQNPPSKPFEQSTGWWNCLPCQAEFFTEDSKLIAIVFTNLKMKLNESHTLISSWYEIIINLELHTTSIECITNVPQNDMSGYKHDSILTLEMIVLGVTPQNVVNKLNTLLIFS